MGDLNIFTAVIPWLAVISIISVALTVYDKYASKHRRRSRIPERLLFLSALLGGSIAMYLTMLLIRHKTKHKRFMFGIPAVILLQYSVLWYCMRII